MTANQVGPMFGLFFTASESVTSFAEVSACNGEQFNLFFHGMLEKGVYLAPSAFEAGFISAAHSNDDIDATIEAASEVLKSIA